jgi:hypothetical protein
MDTYDRAWAPFLQWPGDVDERDLASYRDLSMARSPLRRVVHPSLPAEAGVQPVAAEPADRDGPPVRGRPGKRW